MKIEPVATRRVYRKPKTQILPLTAEAADYLTDKRGLSLDTLDAFGVGCTANGNIAIPFNNENGETDLIKFRHPTGGMLELKQQDGPPRELKTFSEKDGRPVMLGSHLAHASAGPLVICFGDYDAMSLYEAGVSNAVSVPNGDGGLDFIREQWDFLESFPEVILFPDRDDYPNEEARQRAQKKLDEMANRLGIHRCRIVRDQDRTGAKDPNELLVQGSPEAVAAAVANAIEYPVDGLVRVADYIDDEVKIGRPSGFEQIDRNTGGFGDGDLVIISGDNGAGKTTVALNLVAKAVDLRSPTLFWSGEQNVGKLRYWFHRIVAGRGNLIHEFIEATNFTVYKPHPAILQDIKDWYRDHLFSYVNFVVEPEKFFAAVEIAIRRYGIKYLVIDNLMAFTGGEGDGYYQAQGDFTQSCKMFAEKWKITVFLLTHNRKLPRATKVDDIKLPGKDDVEGSKKITNWADVVIQMYKIPPELRIGEYAGVHGVINVCKSRETGGEGAIPVTVDYESNRIEPLNVPPIQYGWTGPAYKRLSAQNA